MEKKQQQRNHVLWIGNDLLYEFKRMKIDVL